MPLALEGVDLIVIALFLFLLAFLHATKWTIEPVIHVLHSALGWVPFAGDIVDKVDHAVIGALNDAIAGTEEAISTLWAGLVWSFNEMVDGLTAAWNATAGALEHAFGTTIPNALVDVYHDARAAGTTVAGKVAGIEGRIVDAVKEAEAYAAKEAKAAITAGEKYVDRQIEKVRATVAGDVTAIDTRIDGLAKSVTTALDDAEKALAAAAGSTSTTITKIIEGAGAEIVAEVAAAEDAVAGELPRLGDIAFDDVETLLRSKEFGTLAGLLAAIPLVNALVHALAVESGLGRRECRDKVKQICATNPARWAHLLEALAVSYAFSSLEDFVGELQRVTVEVAGIVQDFVGAGA